MDGERLPIPKTSETKYIMHLDKPIKRISEHVAIIEVDGKRYSLISEREFFPKELATIQRLAQRCEGVGFPIFRRMLNQDGIDVRNEQ